MILRHREIWGKNFTKRTGHETRFADLFRNAGR